jgi:hypothetical protein
MGGPQAVPLIKTGDTKMTYDANCSFLAGETASDLTYDDLPTCPCCGTMIVADIVNHSTDETPDLFGCLKCETVWVETYSESRDAPHFDMGG